MEISTPVEETKQEEKREETVAKQNSSRDAATVKGVFPCTECDFVATTSLGLSKHMVSKHGALSKKDKKRLRDEEKINDDHDNTIELINAKVKDVEPPSTHCCSSTPEATEECDRPRCLRRERESPATAQSSGGEVWRGPQLEV
jgi:hypothetical protein